MVLFFFGLIPLASSAHLPRYLLDQDISLHQPIEIDEPWVSQIFYGQTQDTPDYYHFKLEQNQDILIGLLAPINEKEFPVLELTAKAGDLNQKLQGQFGEVFFEEFGGDYYLKGPEKTFSLKSGDYLLTVTPTKASSTERCALVIGQEEKFSLIEIVSTFFLLPIIKQKFFDRPILEMFLAVLSFIFLTLTLTFSLNRSWKISWRFFGASLLAFTLSTILLLIKNPFNLLGFLKIALFLVAAIVAGIYLKKKGEPGKIFKTITFALWLLVVFLTIASF